MTTCYHKNSRPIVIVAEKLFASKVVQLTRDVRLCTALFLSLSHLVIARSSLCAICGTRNHRLAKIRRPAILRLYCTHLQNKNTYNELITFYPQILVLMWITSSRISHAVQATRRFLASVVLIKKENSFMQTRVTVRKELIRLWQ